MDRKQRLQAFRKLAANLDGIDLAVYRDCGADPLEPIIGEGDPQARLAIFGRDPGREEVRHRTPFIGAGGQKVRAVLHHVCYRRALTDFQASLEVGKYLFWANTVPYKPIGNKAWSQKIKKAFQPLMADLLLTEWLGGDVLTLGREAFLWFGINQSKATRGALETHWRKPDRFETSLSVAYEGPHETQRVLRLHPLPHPSPLNAVWYRHFPKLLEKRLRMLDFGPHYWRIAAP